MCMCVCVSHVCGSEAIRGHRIPGNWNPCSFELPCGCWESEFGPLRSLQLLFFPFLSALIRLLFLHWLLLLTTHVLEAAAGAQDGLAFVTTFMEECSLCSSSVKLCSAAEHTTRHWCSFCARISFSKELLLHLCVQIKTSLLLEKLSRSHLCPMFPQSSLTAWITYLCTLLCVYTICHMSRASSSMGTLK